MRPIILLFCLIATSASAQHLTKAQEAREALGNCYSDCTFRGYASGQFIIQLGLTLPSNPNQTQAFYGCIAVQEHVRQMDACYAGCYDIEQAYGVRSSSTRSRFLRFLKLQRDPLRATGLWREYSNSPNYYDSNNPAFAQACNRYIRLQTTSSQATRDEMLVHDPSGPYSLGDDYSDIPVDGAEEMLMKEALGLD